MRLPQLAQRSFGPEKLAIFKFKNEQFPFCDACDQPN